MNPTLWSRRVLTTTLRKVIPMSLYLRRRPLSPQLAPGRLQDYLQAIRDRADLPGAVLEVGCFRGATTVVAAKMLRDMGQSSRQYMCVDTFEGFVADQFEVDVEHGTPESFGTGFSQNPKEIFERTMRHFDVSVEAVQADIVQVDPSILPARVAVCLMDVDLAVPIREGLAKVRPLMAEGGVMLVDDCDEGTDWRGARVGYEEYMQAEGLEPRYTASGFGVVDC
jgi:O-methyltransferase